MSNASTPINTQEMEICSNNGVNCIELLIAFDVITVVKTKNRQVTSITDYKASEDDEELVAGVSQDTNG